MKYVEPANPDRKQNGGCHGLGEEGKGNCLVGTEFQICKMKSSGDLFYNTVNILNTIELYTLKWKMLCQVAFITIRKKPDKQKPSNLPVDLPLLIEKQLAIKQLVQCDTICVKCPFLF